MAIQHAVKELLTLGQIPTEDDDVAWSADPNPWFEWLNQVEKPVSDEDAKALCTVFGNDMGYGLGWAVLHAVETSPGWPLNDAIQCAPPLWRKTLMIGCNNADLVRKS